MQTCSQCNASSIDSATNCHQCNADLGEYSVTSVTLRKLQNNPRVSAIRLTAAADACPICYGTTKAYQKNEVPALPHPGCSHENGCRCFYEPILAETAIVGKVVK